MARKMYRYSSNQTDTGKEKKHLNYSSIIILCNLAIKAFLDLTSKYLQTTANCLVI